MTKRTFLAAAATVALGLAGCNAKSLQADPQVIADADAAFQELSSGADKALLARMPKEVTENPGQVRLVGLMRQLLPPAKAGPFVLIGWRLFAGTSGRQHTAVLRYDYDNGEHITASYLFTKPEADGPWRMTTFHIQPSSPDEAAAPAVATSLIAGKGAK